MTLHVPQPTGRAATKCLQAELARAYQTIALLRLQLAHHNIHSINVPPKWAKYLTPQETALMQMLLDAHPRFLPNAYLFDNLPGYDHVVERNSNIIKVVVCRVRSSLGPDSILTIWGQGYRCSDEFASMHKNSSP